LKSSPSAKSILLPIVENDFAKNLLEYELAYQTSSAATGQFLPRMILMIATLRTVELVECEALRVDIFFDRSSIVLELAFQLLVTIVEPGHLVVTIEIGADIIAVTGGLCILSQS